MAETPTTLATRYSQISRPLTSTVYMTQPIAQTRAPKATKTGLTKHQIHRAAPTVSRPAFTVPPQPQTPKSSPPNHGAIVGGIFGAILAFVVLLLLIKLCRPRNKKYHDVEQGRHRHRHHDTRAVLDEVQRRNHKRRCGHHHRADTAAIDLAHVRNWEHGFDTNRFRPAQRVRPHSISSFGMSPEELAQAHAWIQGISTAGLYGGSKRTVPSAYPQYPVTMPTRKPMAQAGRMPSVRKIERGRAPVRSVSPLSSSERGYAGGYVRGNYGDVSPLGSPNRDKLF